MEFKDKVCVVTGGSNGIGKKIIEDFIKAGSKVCFIDIDEKGAKALIDKYKENILYFKGDISEECTLKDFYKVVKENYDKIDYLINNACISKDGITALTHALSVSLAGKVRVNSISPGWIETSENIEHSIEDKNQHLVKRVGKVSDISNMVMFLCSERASFITGQDISIDGGMTKLMIYNNDCGWNYNE